MKSEHLNETKALPAKIRDELTDLGWYLLQRDDTTLFPSPLIKFKWNACLLTACAVRAWGFLQNNYYRITCLQKREREEKGNYAMRFLSENKQTQMAHLEWAISETFHQGDFSDIAQIQWINDRQPFSPPLDFKSPLWCHQKDKQISQMFTSLKWKKWLSYPSLSPPVLRRASPDVLTWTLWFTFLLKHLLLPCSESRGFALLFLSLFNSYNPSP